MKQLVLVLAMVLALFSASAQETVTSHTKEIRFIVDTCITLMKQHAVNAGKVDWNKLQQHAYEKASGITHPYKMGPVISYLYQSLDDFHGMLYYYDSVFKWRPNEIPVSDSIMNEWKKGVKSVTRVLENNIGYLRIPSMPFTGREDDDKKAQSLNDSLCSLLQKNVKGIILDLRLNGGGAMYPMILGLQQLLGNGKVGSFLSEKDENWYLDSNKFKIGTTDYASIIPRCAINAQNIPVVMLISPHTGSSGEFLVMSFKGRKNTILLGSKTAGYITVVSGYPIRDGAHLLLAVNYGADRNGKVYTKAIEPDIPFNGIDSFNDIPNDEKVKAAVKWLKSLLP